VQPNAQFPSDAICRRLAVNGKSDLAQTPTEQAV